MRIVRLLLVLAVIVFGVSRGLPWVMSQLDSTRGINTDSQGGTCVAHVQLARDDFGKAARSMRNPPYDLELWDDLTLQLENQLAEADSNCGCALESCRRGQAASEGLRQLIDTYSEGIRGETLVLNLANRIERVDDLLDEARAAARNEG